jgi:hypothetical protein
VTVPELLLWCDLGRVAGVPVCEGRSARKDGDADVVVWERGRCGVPGTGVAGRDGAGCFHDGWKREKKLGESGVEGEEAVVEIGEVVVEVEVEVDVHAEAEVEAEGEDL